MLSTVFVNQLVYSESMLHVSVALLFKLNVRYTYTVHLVYF